MSNETTANQRTKPGPKPRVRSVCTVDECLDVERSAGLCNKHRLRLQRRGSTQSKRTPPGTMRAEFDRLVAIVTDECVEWTGATTLGYGHLRVGGVDHRTHRLALQAVTDSSGSGMQAAHGPCHNLLCMNALGGHVYWATSKRNAADKMRDGTNLHGESHPGAKLTEDEVISIRSNYGTNREVAAEYGVTHSNIGAIRTRKSWKHI